MKRPIKAWLAIGFTVFGIAAVGGGVGVAWYLREHRDAYFTDADTIDLPVHKASPRDILWRDPVDLPPVINTAADEYGPTLSPDGLALYFARRPEGDGSTGLDLFVCVKTPTGWSEARAIDALNSEGDDLDPVMTADGRAIYFCSNRPGGSGDYDLWMTRAGDDGSWATPTNLGPAVNSRGNDYGPALTPDGTILYFASDRPGPGDAEPRSAGASVSGVARPDFDLYSLDLTVPDGVPLAVDGLNTALDESAPAVSPAGDFVYFASDRAGGQGGFDLYRSRRLDGRHLPALNMGTPVNTAGSELDPAVSLEGFGLHFSSKPAATPEGEEAGAGDADFDLRYAVSREVFTRTDTYRADLDWGTLWAQLWPYLVWLMAAIFLLLLLALLFQHFEFRKLSLLMRCLMVSLLIHMLLMIAFAFWGVSSVLSEWTRPGKGMRVVLTSPSVGSGLAGQIRATLDQPDVETQWPEAAARRLAAAEDIPADDTDVQADAQPVEASRIESAATPVVTASANDAPADAAQVQPATTTATIAQANPVELDVPAEASQAAHAEAASASVSAASMQRPRAARSEGEVVSASTPAPTVSNATPVESARLDDSEAVQMTARTREAPAASAMPAPDSPAQLPDLADLEPVPVDGPSERADSRQAEATGAIVMTAAAATRTSRAQPSTSANTDGIVTSYTATAVDTPSTVIGGEPAPVTMTGPRQGATAPMPTPQAATETGTSRPIDLALPAMQERPGDAPARVAERGADIQAVASRAEASGRSAAAATPALDATDVHAAAQIQPAGTTYGVAPLAAAGAAMYDAPATAAAATPGSADVTPTIERPSALAFDLPRVEESSVVSEPERATRSVQVPRSSARPRWAAPTESSRAATDHVPSYTAQPAMTSVERRQTRRSPGADVPSERLDVDRVEMPVLASLDLDLKIPTRTAPLPDPYRHREPEVREEILEEMGGSKETEEAVAMALDWLARHQGPDGRWDGEHYDDRCGQCEGTQRVKCDVALTGLSVLCFVAADHTHVKDGPYRRTVERGLRWLVEHQDADGGLMDGESLYSHGIAAIALAEAYGMTHDPALKDDVESAMNFIYESRNREVGGWRYRPGQAGDTSVMGWQIMALTSAKRAGLDVPEEAFDIADRWLDLVHRPSRPGTYAYQPRREVTPAMTAEGMFVRQLLGSARDEPRMRGSAAYILEHPPTWRPDANTYYWYYATLALFQHQGSEWRQWNEGIKQLLVDRQRTEGRTAGSWDPDGRWAGVAGRVYQTAIATLTLEVYYRYLPLYARQQ